MMKMRYFLAALLMSLAMSATAQAGTYAYGPHYGYGPQRHAYGIVGREVAAPPWSFACLNDQGTRICDEPMWVYGSPWEVERYKSAF
jgi:hypothetical protein